MSASAVRQLIRRRVLPIAILLLSLGVGRGLEARAASAATVTVGVPCVIYDDATLAGEVPFTVTGFKSDNGLIVSSTTGQAYGNTALDASGSGSGIFAPPAPPHPKRPGVFSYTLVANDFVGDTAMTTFSEAPLAFATVPATAGVGKTVTFNFSGFTAGQTIYAHYLLNGRVISTKTFGAAAAPCGTLTGVRTKMYPGTGSSRPDTVQFDNAKRYSPASQPQIVATVSRNSL